jgi:type I restriction enzyme S subunit
MNSGWQNMMVSEFAEVVGGGTPKTAVEQYWNGEIPWVAPSDLTGYEDVYIGKGAKNISELGLSSSSTKLLPKNTVLLSSRAPIGYVAIAANQICTNQGFRSLICNEKKVIPLFLYYALKVYKPTLEAFATGATFPELSGSALKKISLPIPPIIEQENISAILNSYTNLIENNKKRIVILGQITRQIYKEWFVRMRFSGYKNTEFIKGVPKGWEHKKLRSLVKTQYGYTASSGEDSEIGPKFLRITDIAQRELDWEAVPYCEIPDKDFEKYLIKHGDIVIARTGATAGYAKMLIHPPKAVFASYLVRMVPHNLNHNFLLGIAIESKDYKRFIQMVATGAAQPQANAELMCLFNILVPTDDVLQQFNVKIEPLYDTIETLKNQNRKLKSCYDAILPRLISGRLSVEQASQKLQELL